MNTIDQIKNHPTYKAVLNDSFGGCIYNVANRNKYEGAQSVINLWESMTPSEQGVAGGIMKGAISFLKGE